MRFVTVIEQSAHIGARLDSQFEQMTTQDDRGGGMVLNFEKTLMRDGHLGDFEETVIVGEDGRPTLITDAKVRYW